MTSQTTLTCEADTSGRYSPRAHACGQPATMGFRITANDRTERIEARCAKHAGIIKRTRWPGGTLVDLTAEVVDAIAARQAETKARRDAERAAKREADAVRVEAARVEAHELDVVAWSAIRADEQTLETWTTDGPVYRAVPRWEVRREDGQGWDTATVKADRRADGWPAEITLSAPSRLTRRQAIALAEALLAAAGAEAPECDGFTGGNAWGACAECGKRLEDHTAGRRNRAYARSAGAPPGADEAGDHGAPR